MIGDVLTLFFQDEFEHYRIDKINDETIELTGEHGSAFLKHKNGLLESFNGKQITGFTMTAAPSPFVAGTQVRISTDDRIIDGQVIQYENHILEVVYQDEHYYLDMDNLPVEISSVAPIEVQDLVNEVCDECTPDEHLLLAFQLNDLKKALDGEGETLVKRFRELVEQFTDSAREPVALPGIVETLTSRPPPWVIPVIDSYKKVEKEISNTCDANYADPSKTKGRYAAYLQCLDETLQTFEGTGSVFEGRVDAVTPTFVDQTVVDEPVSFSEFKQLLCAFSADTLRGQLTLEAATMPFYRCRASWLNAASPLDVDVSELLKTCEATTFAEVVEELAPYGVKWWHVTLPQRREIDALVKQRVNRLKFTSKEAAPSTSLPKADTLYLLPPMLASERLATRLSVDGLRGYLGNKKSLERRLARSQRKTDSVVETAVEAAKESVTDVVSAYYGGSAEDALSILMRYGRDARNDEDPGWSYFKEEKTKLASLCLYEAHGALVDDGASGYEREVVRVDAFDVDGFRVHHTGTVLGESDFKDNVFRENPESPFQWLWVECDVPVVEQWRAVDLVSATALGIVFGADRKRMDMHKKSKNFEERVAEAVKELHFLQPPATSDETYTGSCAIENIKNVEAKRLDCAAQAIPMIKSVLGKEVKMSVRKTLLSSNNLAARLKAVNALTPNAALKTRTVSRKVDELKKQLVPFVIEDEPTEHITLCPILKEWGFTTGEEMDGGKVGNMVKKVTEQVASFLKRKPVMDLVADLVGEWKGVCRLSEIVHAHVEMAIGVLPHMAMLGFQHFKTDDLPKIVRDYYEEFKPESSEQVRDVFGLRARNEPNGEFGDAPPEKFAAYYESKAQSWKEIRQALYCSGEWRPAILKYCLLRSWCLLLEEGEYGEMIATFAVSRFVLDASKLNPLPA